MGSHESSQLRELLARSLSPLLHGRKPVGPLEWSNQFIDLAVEELKHGWDLSGVSVLDLRSTDCKLYVYVVPIDLCDSVGEEINREQVVGEVWTQPDTLRLGLGITLVEILRDDQFQLLIERLLAALKH